MPSPPPPTSFTASLQFTLSSIRLFRVRSTKERDLSRDFGSTGSPSPSRFGQIPRYRPRRPRATHANRQSSTVHWLVPTRAWCCAIHRPHFTQSSTTTLAYTARASIWKAPSVCKDVSPSSSSDSRASKRAVTRESELASDRFDGQDDSQSAPTFKTLLLLVLAVRLDDVEGLLCCCSVLLDWRKLRRRREDNSGFREQGALRRKASSIWRQQRNVQKWSWDCGTWSLKMKYWGMLIW